MPPLPPDQDPLPAPSASRWFVDEVLPHEAGLRLWLLSRFRTLGDIDDLVQESFARLLRARDAGTIACPKAFLYVTARNLALNQLRHRRYSHPEGLTEYDVSAVLDEGAAIPDSVARAEDLQVLIQAIQTLPDRCRQVMTLRKIYGLSQREIAGRLGISENTVEAQGAIGLRKCIEYFRRRGDTARFHP